jgi:hypothetical protein
MAAPARYVNREGGYRGMAGLVWSPGREFCREAIRSMFCLLASSSLSHSARVRQMRRLLIRDPVTPSLRQIFFSVTDAASGLASPAKAGADSASTGAATNRHRDFITTPPDAAQRAVRSH